MYGDRYIVAKCVVVQHIDGEEQEDVDEPTADGNAVGPEEEGGSVGVELGEVACDGDEDELHKSQEGS